jgi:CRISPR-associated endonuclease Csn1
MKKFLNDYYLGLDIGTDSIGWAVTDKEYNLEKINGKILWGVRLFDPANTAAERRTFRSARRRLKRRNWRISLLQELLAEEISKIDLGFYQRLKDSKYYIEDKSEFQKNTLFNDVNFVDQDLHKKYPTIYHLRKALIDNSQEAFDIRLLYLAIHNILKHRGHFLFEGQSMNSVTDFSSIYYNLKQIINDELEIDFNCSDLEMMETILKDKSKGMTKKKIELLKLFNLEDKIKEKQVKELVNIILGGKADLSIIFADDTLKEFEVKSVSFSDSNYEDNKLKLEAQLEDRITVIEKLKEVYDWSVLSTILQNQNYLSYAKVLSYEKHKKDLKKLQSVIKKYKPEVYKNIFSNSNNEKSYCAYIMKNNTNGKKSNEIKRCNQEDFCKEIIKVLSDINFTGDKELEELKIDAESISLLPLQISSKNGVIPYQLHGAELEKILENAKHKFAFLNDIDETGISIKEKITKIFEFRIPYYVGPLNNYHNKNEDGFSWVIKKDNAKILPWNFEEIVDLEKSAEEFIKGMTNKCTYLVDEDVLPKDSLLYSEFMVLNELNNLKINQEKIDAELKKKIYADLFLKYKKVTGKKLRDYLLKENVIDKNDYISGFDLDFKSSLRSKIEIINAIGSKADNLELCESIILYITLYGEDKKLLKSRLSKLNPSLDEKEINEIVKLKFSGWGRLSKTFLTEISHIDKATGEYQSIMTNLRETNNNMMQLLSRDFDYLDSINEFNKNFEAGTIISYETVDDLYVSPSVKKMIWQSLCVVNEIHKVMGKHPKKLFIEMARGEEDKKRTVSRKNTLIDFYKLCGEEGKIWIKNIENATDNDLRRDRLYLYYTQLGKCMYSGKAISLKDLFNANIYDVDHIFPQSKVKDDGLDNRVLVLKEVNSLKSDSYPLSNEIRSSNSARWSYLKDKGLINLKKYERLIRSVPFTDNELTDFIARQLVETRQTSKAAAEILKKVFPESDIVYVKARNVSEFRQDRDLVKVRDVNDFHHAYDAYLNIVVGNVYFVKFTSNPINFINDKSKPKYNLGRMFDFDVKRGEETAWIHGEKGTISKVKKTIQKNNVLFTRYATESKGGISDQNIVKKKDGLLPIKGSDKKLADTTKYGGFNSIKGAYFFLVEHSVIKGKNNNRIRTIEFVPIHLKAKIESSEDGLQKYAIENLGLIEPVIKLKKIKINALFEIDGFKMHLSARSGDQLKFKGANQLYVAKTEADYIRKCINLTTKLKERRIKAQEYIVTRFDQISADMNMQLFDMFIFKLGKSPFSIKLSTQAETLKSKRLNFSNLIEAEQAVVISEIIHLFQCNIVTANLKIIGGAESAGLVATSKIISNFKSVKLVNQSVTGIFENEIDLLNI